MKVRSSIRPQEITITATSVFIASNIQQYQETVDDHYLEGYEYDCIEYSKDDYLALQGEKIASLEEELRAAKILLGVDE